MKKQLAQVHQFHQTAGSTDVPTPTKDIPEDVKRLRIRLIQEEATEVVQAIDREPIDALAKELADLLYVTLGTIESFGLGAAMEEVFDAVHTNNMGKFDGDVHTNVDGKIVKKAGYAKPDIKAILEKYL